MKIFVSSKKIIYHSILWLILVINCNHIIGQIVDRTSYKLINNVVKITSKFEDETYPGFGFVMYENKQSVYVATAKHVCFSEKTKNNPKVIIVEFYSGYLTYEVRINNLHPTLDLALLKVKKPEKFKWEYQHSTRNSKSGDKVWIIGRDGKWDPTASGMAGIVVSNKPREIRVDYSGVRGGTSGGPLIGRGGIVGMVIEDDGDLVNAIPIRIIKHQVFNWLKVDAKNIYDLPYFIAGFYGRINSGIETEKGAFSQENLYKYSLPGPGLFINFAFHPKFSIRLEGVASRLKSKSFLKDDVNYQFRNHFNTFTLSIIYHPRYNIFSNQFLNLYFGLSLVKINPQIRQDDGSWESLKNLEGANHSYSNNSLSVSIGIGHLFFITENFAFVFEAGCSYFTTKYLFMNIKEPFLENKNNDLLITLNIGIGYVFRKVESKIKFLR